MYRYYRMRMLGSTVPDVPIIGAVIRRFGEVDWLAGSIAWLFEPTATARLIIGRQTIMVLDHYGLTPEGKRDVDRESALRVLQLGRY